VRVLIRGRVRTDDGSLEVSRFTEMDHAPVVGTRFGYSDITFQTRTARQVTFNMDDGMYEVELNDDNRREGDAKVRISQGYESLDFTVTDLSGGDSR